MKLFPLRSPVSLLKLVHSRFSQLSDGGCLSLKRKWKSDEAGSLVMLWQKVEVCLDEKTLKWCRENETNLSTMLRLGSKFTMLKSSLLDCI